MVRRRPSLVAGLAVALVAGLLAMIPGTSAVSAAAGDATLPAATPVAKVSAPPMVFPCNKKLAAPAMTDAGWSLAKSMPVVERSQTSTTYEGPCNTRTMEIHQSAVNWMDPSTGTWKPIDRRLIRAESGRWKNASGPFSIELADEMNARSLATVAKDGWSIGFTLDGTNPTTAVVSDDTVRYLDVVPGIDLEEEVTTTGLKESVVVNVLPSGVGDLTFNFPLNLAGVTPSVAEDGGIMFTAGGTKVATVAPAVAWDANKAPVPGSIVPIPQTLVRSGDGWALRLTVPASWARDAARALPITVDPTITVENTSSANDQDAFASSPDPNGVYRDWTWDGGRHEDWVGYDNYPASQQWTYQNFDVSALNGKATIISATWRDFVISNKVGDPAWTDYFKISAVSNWPNNQWNINDIHWSTAGDQGVIGHYGTPYFEARQAPGGFAYVDIQPFVRFWTNGSWPNYGIQIDTGGHNNAVHFASNQEPAGVNPAIVVSYNSAPYIPDQLNPASGWSDPTSPPPLSARFSDMDGDNGNVDFEVTRPDGTTIFQPVGTTNGATASFTPAVTAPGTYSWRVRAWDGLDVSPWSESRTFTIIGDVAPNVPDNLAPDNNAASASAPTLSARYTAGDGQAGWIEFDMGGEDEHDEDRVPAANNATATYIPAVGEGTWSWRARATDGRYASAWTPWRYFSVRAGLVWYESFSGNNGDLWNNTRWSTGTNGLTRTVDIQNNEGRLYVNGSSAGANARQAGSNINLADIDVAFTFRFENTNSRSFLRVRARDSGTNAYRVELRNDTTTIKLQNILNGVSALITQFTYNPDGQAGFDPGNHRLRVQVQGSTVRVKAWPATSAETDTWQIDRTDTSVTGPGGLKIDHNYDTGSRSIYVDDVAITNLQVQGGTVAELPMKPKYPDHGFGALATSNDAFIGLSSDRCKQAELDAMAQIKATTEGSQPEFGGAWPNGIQISRSTNCQGFVGDDIDILLDYMDPEEYEAAGHTDSGAEVHPTLAPSQYCDSRGYTKLNSAGNPDPNGKCGQHFSLIHVNEVRFDNYPSALTRRNLLIHETGHSFGFIDDCKVDAITNNGRGKNCGLPEGWTSIDRREMKNKIYPAFPYPRQP